MSTNDDALLTRRTSLNSLLRPVLNLTDGVLGLGALCYFLGFAITSFYFSIYSISDIELLRTRYIITGALFIAFFLVIADGIAYGWRLTEKPDIGDERHRLRTLGAAIARPAYLIVLPYLVIVTLPRLIAQVRVVDGYHLEFHKFTQTRREFWVQFVLAWIVPFIVVGIVGALLRTMERFGLRGVPRFRASVSKAFDLRAMPAGKVLLIRARGRKRSDGETSADQSASTAWQWGIAVVVSVAALIYYAQTIFPDIPGEFGGGEPLPVNRVQWASNSQVGSTIPSRGVFDIVAKTSDSYIIRVHFGATQQSLIQLSKDEVVGLYYDDPTSLDLRNIPKNNDIGRAQILEGDPITIDGATRLASVEKDELPLNESWQYWGQHSVWYAWKAPRSARFTVDTCNAATDTYVSVLRVKGTGAFVPLRTTFADIEPVIGVEEIDGKFVPPTDPATPTTAVQDNNGCPEPWIWGSKLSFQADEGVTYMIRVDDIGGAKENWFVLQISQ